MFKKILFLLVTLVTLGQNLYGDDYYNYGEWHFPEVSGAYTGVGGFVDKNGRLGEEGDEYIFFTSDGMGYVYRVETEGDPNMHPNNPDATGDISPRSFTFVNSHVISYGVEHENAFYVDDTGIYYGARLGIKRWDFDWSNETTIVSTPSPYCQTFGRNSRTGEWWVGGTYERKIYKWNGSSWAYQFTYPNLGGNHHDGMEVANDTIFLSDMTSDKIATYKLDEQGNVINPQSPDHIYSYSASPVVEGMGFGPNKHLWISGHIPSIIYEVGGGKLQEELAPCTQKLDINAKWEMLSSKCDVVNATGFTDAVIMKMVGESLVIITDDDATANYYQAQGYETNSTLEFSRGEGFWIRGREDNITHKLTGEEDTISIGLEGNTTRFIGLPNQHEIDLDEVFGDKPVKEIKYFDSNTTSWKKWQPDHSDTNLSKILNGAGFYICIADDFNISLSNIAPIANAGEDQNITFGDSVVLDASESFDKDGEIVEYRWSENNVVLSIEEVFSKSDFSEGFHKILLTVTDNDGDTNSQEITIRVAKNNQLPTVDIGDDLNITIGETLTLSADAHDTDGTIISYEWRDGNQTIGTTRDLSINTLLLGEHNISVEVIDSDLGHAIESIIVMVNNIPDTTPPVMTILGNNPMVVIVGSSFTDPGAVAVDNEDGNLTVQVTGSVDVNAKASYTLTYSATDSAGNNAEQNRTVIVQDQSSNQAPTVNAGVDRDVTQGTTLILSAVGNDVDGSIAQYEWKRDGESITIRQTLTLSNLNIGTYIYTVIITDNDGAIGSDSITIKVVAGDNQPPVITILGNNPFIMNIGEAYVDSGSTAIDDIDGNVNVATNYSFNSSVEGTYIVTYSAIDSSGNLAEAYRSVMVVDSSTPDTTPPVITMLGDNPLTIFQGTAFSDPGVTVVDDHDGAIGYSMINNVNSAVIGSYFVTYSATDSAGNSSEVNRTVYVKDPNGNRVPTADAGDDVSKDLGEDVTLNASGSSDIDGEIISYKWQEGNITLSTDINFTKNDFSFGSHEITLIVKDNEGAMASDMVIVRIIDSSDVTPPIAQITSPTDSSELLIVSDIIGTASDENLDYYELLISPVGEESYTQFLEANSSVTDATLGQLDATTIRNGIYDILLKAVDKNGAVTTDKKTVIIKGKAKIGNFSFTVTDFDLQVGGLPVQVNRTYSTLQRLEKLDFTYGWSIDYQNVKIEENTHPGYDWKMTPDTLIGYCFKFDKQHVVNIAMPDGSTESFEFKFERECGHYQAGSFYDAPKLYALNGSEAKLEALGVSDVVSMYHDGRIIDGNSLQPYDPNRYKLTMSNGMAYEVIQGVGLKQITSLIGDTLTYSENGILSSRGESLTFTRDNQNRIIRITDLAERNVTYHYDQNDNLDYVVDQLGQTTTYSYQSGHLLEEYFDPSGTRLTKNFYDEAGRLIKTEDADGNIVEFTHDIDGREEMIKDKLGRVSLFVYDDEGNVLSKTNPLGESTTYTYDSKGNVLTTTDPLGNTINNTYDTQGNLLTTTDSIGNVETTSYNSNGSPLSIGDKNGNTMSIVYNAYNSPRSMTTAKGATNTYYYDQYGNRVSSTNEYNKTTNYVYDEHYITLIGGVSSKGNLLKETQPNGTVIEHTYDDSSNLLTTIKTYTKPDGTTATTSVSNSYDAFNRLIGSTDELGNSSTNSYDARGNQVSSMDGEGRTTTYEYTPSNKQKKITYPDGTTESKTYDAMDNLLSETNQEGETTSYEYDDADRLTKTTYPDNSTTSTTYDEAGRVIISTDQNGNSTTYEYNAVGNRVSSTDALNNRTTYTYDAQGNMLTVADALNQTTTYEYNELNQRVKTIYADGSIVQELKNISGLPSKKIDENNQEIIYDYDTSRAMPLLNQVTLANGAVTTYGYNKLGAKVTQTDALNHSITWSYKNTGELEREILPLGQIKTLTYDGYGKQTEINDYANKATKFIYDSHDKLVRVEQADGTTTTYDYTPSGRLKTQTDAQGSIEKTYDNRGRLKTQTNPNNETITYSYDGVGNIVEVKTPTQTITKTYDALKRLKTVTDVQGTTTYSYDAIGRQTGIAYANGTTSINSYDSRNRVTKIEHKDSSNNILQSFTYTLDNIGNRTKVVEATGRMVDYSYNNVNQLLSETVSSDPSGNNTITSFTYDVVGNMLTKTIDGTIITYEYNANDQLTTQGTVSFSYDNNGNLISKGTTSYEYDDKNRLVKTITPTNIIEYAYDANDNRVAKVTNGETTTYLIDTNTAYAQVITESKENGTEVNYSYGNDLISDGSNLFLTDALGSTRGLVDDAETLTDSYNYTPYGILAEHNGTSENSFLYTGEQLDQETEDYFLRARYYSPNTSRFLSRDTYDGVAGNPITKNHYVYGNSNPVTYVDLSGHMSMMSASFSSVVTGILSGVSRISMGIGNRILYNVRANKKYAVHVKRAPSPLAIIPHEFIVISGIKRRVSYRYDIGLCNPKDDLKRVTYGHTVPGTLTKTVDLRLRNKRSWVRFSNLQFMIWEQLNYTPYKVNNYTLFAFQNSKLNCWTWSKQAWRSAIKIMLLTPSR